MPVNSTTCPTCGLPCGSCAPPPGRKAGSDEAEYIRLRDEITRLKATQAKVAMRLRERLDAGETPPGVRYITKSTVQCAAPIAVAQACKAAGIDYDAAFNRAVSLNAKKFLQALDKEGKLTAEQSEAIKPLFTVNTTQSLDVRVVKP